MMQSFATNTISQAALTAGLPEGRVMAQTAKDNLTLERPRIEVQFLPERYTRSGRKLAVTRTATELVRKRELYVVRLDVATNVLADNQGWLGDFCYHFMAALPAGANDSRGNYVKIRAEKATFSKAPDKRLGDAVIEVFTKVNQLFQLSFTWRVTTEEAELLIRTINIQLPTWEGTHNGKG